jgi:hypothetical protein
LKTFAGLLLVLAMTCGFLSKEPEALRKVTRKVVPTSGFIYGHREGLAQAGWIGALGTIGLIAILSKR